jgi:hypothetical protein
VFQVALVTRTLTDTFAFLTKIKVRRSATIQLDRGRRGSRNRIVSMSQQEGTCGEYPWSVLVSLRGGAFTDKDSDSESGTGSR